MCLCMCSFLWEVHRCVSAGTCVFVCLHAYVCVSMCVRLNLHLSIRDVFMCACMYVCQHVCIHVCVCGVKSSRVLPCLELFLSRLDRVLMLR